LNSHITANEIPWKYSNKYKTTTNCKRENDWAPAMN